MKKSYIFALVLLGLVIVTVRNINRGNVEPSTSSYVAQDDYVEEEETEEVYDIESPTNITTGTVLYHTSSGYKYEMTISVGEWIKGSDTEKLQQQWQYFGEDGDFSFLGDNHSRQIYLMGEISFENKTEGDFPITDIDSQMLFLAIHGSDGGYIKKGEVSHLINIYNHGVVMYSSPSYFSGETLYCSPGFKSDYWGPVTFVIAFDDMLGPDKPDGDAEIDRLKLSIANNARIIDHSDNFSISSVVRNAELPLSKSW